MQAPKSIEINMPEEIDGSFYEKMHKYHSIESKIAYLNILEKEAIKFYKSKKLENDDLSKRNLTEIFCERENLIEELEQERKKTKSLIFKYSEETILVELEIFDTVEEQIEYLIKKIREYEIDAVDVTTNQYDNVKNILTILLRNRESLLGIPDKIEGLGKLNDQKKLKQFARGDLQRELKKMAEKFNLIKGESVPSKRVLLITNSLRQAGWDAKMESVATTLRKLEYVEGRRE